MRDNVGILEISSAMMRDLVHEACAPLGRISVYADLAATRRALETLPPKVLVIGGAPLDAAAHLLLRDAVEKHSVIVLVLVDRHDLSAAMHVGASDGYPRNAEGLRQLKLRLRPLLAPSLRPPADERAIVAWSSRAPAGSPNLTIKSGAPQPAARSSASPPSATVRRCNVIALGAEAASVDGIAYVLSRLPTTAPGIVVQTHAAADTTGMVQRLEQESSWRAQEARAGDAITAGSVLIAPGSCQLRIGQGDEGPVIAAARASSAPSCDALFESVAESAAKTALGVLLLSASGDGTRGLAALRGAGGYTIVQRAPTRSTRSVPAAQSGGARSATPPPDDRSLGFTPHESVELSELPQAIAAFCSARAGATRRYF